METRLLNIRLHIKHLRFHVNGLVITNKGDTVQFGKEMLQVFGLKMIPYVLIYSRKQKVSLKRNVGTFLPKCRLSSPGGL